MFKLKFCLFFSWLNSVICSLEFLSISLLMYVFMQRKKAGNAQLKLQLFDLVCEVLGCEFVSLSSPALQEEPPLRDVLVVHVVLNL